MSISRVILLAFILARVYNMVKKVFGQHFYKTTEQIGITYYLFVGVKNNSVR